MKGEKNIQDFDQFFNETTLKTKLHSNYTIHGEEVLFSSNSIELRDEINHDLKWFHSLTSNSSKIKIQSILGFSDKNNPFSSPPQNSRVIWKNPEGSIISYSYDGLLINYYFQDYNAIAFEILDLDMHRSLCFGDHVGILYEITLLNLERQISHLLEKRNVFFLHAAALEKAGKGVIFPATTSFGKTNLTLSLLKYGFKLLSDDKIFIDVKEKRMMYYPRRLRVDKDTISRFSELEYLLTRKPLRFHKGKIKWLIDFEENEINVSTEAKLKYIIFPSIWVNKESKLVKANTRSSVSRLLQSIEGIMNVEKRKAVFDLVTGAECLELLMGDNSDKLGRTVAKRIESDDHDKN